VEELLDEFFDPSQIAITRGFIAQLNLWWPIKEGTISRQWRWRNLGQHHAGST
jgi:hypothetical protein